MGKTSVTIKDVAHRAGVGQIGPQRRDAVAEMSDAYPAEVSAGGIDYTNPDALCKKYPAGRA